MTDLETMLRDAAEADSVSFDHDDIRRRVGRRQRARMVMVGVLAVVVVGAGLLTVDRGGEDARVASESGMVGDLSVEELTADRWVPYAYSAVTTGVDGPFVEFRDDGSFVGVFACDIVTARWSVSEGRLAFDDIEAPIGPPGDDGTPDCRPDGGVAFGELVRSDPVLERFDSPNSMSLRVGDEFVAFRRFDRIGVPPTPASLEGSWNDGQGATVTFHPDGTADLSLPPSGGESCEASSEWRIDDDTLSLTEDLRDGIDCGSGRLAGGGIAWVLGGGPRARIEDGGASRVLWLADEGSVIFLRKADREEPTPGPDLRSAKDVAERAMDAVFGVSAVTKAVEDDAGLHAVTMEVDGGEVVARIDRRTGADQIVDIASSRDLDLVEEENGGFRVAVPEPGRLSVKGFGGDGEPDATDPVFLDGPRDVDAGVTEVFSLPETRWYSLELATERGPVLYLLTRR